MNQTNEKIQSKSFRTKIPLQLLTKCNDKLSEPRVEHGGRPDHLAYREWQDEGASRQGALVIN